MAKRSKQVTPEELADDLRSLIQRLHQVCAVEDDTFKVAGAVKIVGELMQSQQVLDARLGGTLGSRRPVPSGGGEAGERSNVVDFPVGR